jgi:hypothetical protein
MFNGHLRTFRSITPTRGLRDFQVPNFQPTRLEEDNYIPRREGTKKKKKKTDREVEGRPVSNFQKFIP